MKLFLIIVALAFAPSIASAADYPTVKELEGGLGYRPGALLKQAPVNGRGWSFYYVRTRALGNGEYEVKIRLRP